MSARRNPYSSRRSRNVSRKVNDSTLGSHVVRPTGTSRHAASSSSRSRSTTVRRGVDTISPAVSTGSGGSRYRSGSRRQYGGAIQGKARSRRMAVTAVVVVVAVAIAVTAGFLAFRGSLVSEMSLRDSDAADALVQKHSDEPYYLLIAAELGSVAEPLDHAGPDMLLLAYVDRENQKLALINIPAGLQVASENGIVRIASLAESGDAALINAVANFAKVDISHYVKIEEGGVEGMVDALDGIDVEIDQVIDDPHAGDVYLPEGTYTLNGASALTYLRATNLKMGVSDQLDHQVTFAALFLTKLFSSEGSFAARLDAIDSYFQTDLSLGDIEALQSWICNLPSGAINCISLPGYETEVTGVVATEDALFVGSADDMASIIAMLEAGQQVESLSADITPADPGSFTVEVQNGTAIDGAASLTSDNLKALGFNVVAVGNAEQSVYTETLVIYKGDEGPSRAKAVINALGVGRAVSDMYYSFDPDILVILGSDYKPFV